MGLSALDEHEDHVIPVGLCPCLGMSLKTILCQKPTCFCPVDKAVKIHNDSFQEESCPFRSSSNFGFPFP
jgi:hypothetical protein